MIPPVVRVCQDILAFRPTVDQSASQTANAALTEHALTINVPILALVPVDQTQNVELLATLLNVYAEVDIGVIHSTNAFQSEVSKIIITY